tara:strand:+ start:3051 stop:3221 length:171 start_codon:yes stop_codon:yes gene_type:complete
MAKNTPARIPFPIKIIIPVNGETSSGLKDVNTIQKVHNPNKDETIRGINRIFSEFQ